MSPGAEIVLEHVRKGFEAGRIAALEDVSLRVEPGEFVALIGPNGSGKSTLISLVMTFNRPLAGTIRIDGHDLATVRLRDYRANLGVVLQDNLSTARRIPRPNSPLSSNSEFAQAGPRPCSLVQ